MNFRITISTFCIIAVVTAATLSFTNGEGSQSWAEIKPHSTSDRIASENAFLQVYKVFMSPRCMNCHPSGDVPLNGDDNHLHPQGVKRGHDGKGVYALKCSN